MLDFKSLELADKCKIKITITYLQIAEEVRTRFVPLEKVDDTKYRVAFEDRHFDGQK